MFENGCLHSFFTFKKRASGSKVYICFVYIFLHIVIIIIMLLLLLSSSLLFCIVDLRCKFGVTAVSDSAAGMLNVSSHGLCVTVYYELPML